MTVAFLGLTGTQGVLPFCYTEWMLERKAAKDDTLAAFLDLFNHRLVSLFYRAWEKHRPPVLYELGAARDQRPDPFTHSLFDLIGMGTDGLRGRMRVQDESLLLYAGLIAQRPHSASALRGILRDYFSRAGRNRSVRRRLVRAWKKRTAVTSPRRLERNQLGEAAFLGDEVWNQQGALPDSRGPARARPFPGLPARWAGHGQTGAVDAATWSGRPWRSTFRFFCAPSEVPYCRLDDEGIDAPRLG